MIISNSPDITSLLVKVTWDISGASPVVRLENLSTGAHLANISWAFSTLSPSQTPIHTGNINAPDIVGNWTTHVLNDPFPKPFNQIEFSGPPYSFYVTIKDSNGSEYTAPIQYASICRPSGNIATSKTTFGTASAEVRVMCQDAKVFFQDQTAHSYKGTDGTQYSSVLRVVYPIDETLTIPDPFVAAAFSTALVPISYSSSNYQYLLMSIYDYDMGDNVIIRIKYQTLQTFAVWCNIDLLPLRCEIDKLIDSIVNGTCADVNSVTRKLTLITPKFMLVCMGIMQPLIGVDVPTVIEEIKSIGGFQCNCCGAASGIIPTTSSVIDGYNFLFNKLGGDVNGSWTVNGTNITLNIGDVKYVVTVATNSPSAISAQSFSFSPSLSSDGFTKTYSLVVDGTLLATDILNIIKNNTSLVNLFNSIVTAVGGTMQLLVDGKCIFNTGGSCDYTWTLSSIPGSGSNATISAITANGALNNLNYSFNTTTLPALEAYLNTLGLGTFVVLNLGSGVVRITSVGNTHSLGDINYNVASADKLAGYAKNCTGITPISANQVVQNIIDYLCGLDDSQVVTSQPYDICYIDPQSGIKKVSTVASGEEVTVFIQELLLRGCDTIDYIIASNSNINCQAIKNAFPPNINLMQLTDNLFGTKAGQCAIINPVEAAIRMLQLGVYNADFMTAFCAAVSLCAGGLMCDPYSVFQLTIVEGSPVLDLNIIITFTHPSAVSNTIRYARVDNTSTPTYTTIPNVLPGASPYTISNLPDGNYFVGITPHYADGRACAEVSLNSGRPSAGISAFSAAWVSNQIRIDYTAPEAYVRVNINYPNGGTYSHIYANGFGAPILITPPTGVYGDFTVTMTTVFNKDTGFYGDTTPPAIVNVTPPNNSSLVNHTSNALTPISMIVTDGNNVTTIPFNAATVAGGGGVINFYLPPLIQIASILITFGTGTVGEAYFVGDATFVGTITDNHISFDSIDTLVSGGASINLIDPSPAI